MLNLLYCIQSLRSTGHHIIQTMDTPSTFYAIGNMTCFVSFTPKSDEPNLSPPVVPPFINYVKCYPEVQQMPQLVRMNLFEQMKTFTRLRTLLTPGKTKGNKQVLIEVDVPDKTIWWRKLHLLQHVAHAAVKNEPQSTQTLNSSRLSAERALKPCPFHLFT